MPCNGNIWFFFVFWIVCFITQIPSPGLSWRSQPPSTWPVVSPPTPTRSYRGSLCLTNMSAGRYVLQLNSNLTLDLLIYSQQYKHVTTSWKRSGQRSNSFGQSLQIELQILGVFAEESVLNSKLHVHAIISF